MYKRDLNSFVGLNNTGVDDKESIIRLNKYLDLVACCNIKFPVGIDTSQTKRNLNDLSSYLRQNLWDILQDSPLIAAHCINH